MKPWRRHFKALEYKKDTFADALIIFIFPKSMPLLTSCPQAKVKLVSVQISTVIWAGFQR